MTLLQGVTVGFFIPFLPFFFFRTQIFSKRMQMAIVLGAFINVLYVFVIILAPLNPDYFSRCRKIRSLTRYRLIICVLCLITFQ